MQSFEDRVALSRQDGPHRFLAAMCGEWEGTTRTWYQPDKLADESRWTGVIRPVLGGLWVQHEYEGTCSGKPLAGIATFGYDVDLELVEMSWIDTFHTRSAIMGGEGTWKGDGFSVLSTYGSPGAAPWGWRTEVTRPTEKELLITMFNVTPDGKEAKAVETHYASRG